MLMFVKNTETSEGVFVSCDDRSVENIVKGRDFGRVEMFIANGDKLQIVDLLN